MIAVVTSRVTVNKVHTSSPFVNVTHYLSLELNFLLYNEKFSYETIRTRLHQGSEYACATASKMYCLPSLASSTKGPGHRSG